MASKSTKFILLGILFAVLAFFFAVAAENKKAPQGTPILGNGLVICNYHKDQTVALGSIAIATLLLGVLFSHLATFSSYKGNDVNVSVLFECTKLKVFFTIAELVSVATLVLMLWSTVSQSHILRNNIHHDMKTQCPTAKTGLMGGGGLMSVNTALFWFIVYMLTKNRNEDLFDEEFKNHYDVSVGVMDNAYQGYGKI